MSSKMLYDEGIEKAINEGCITHRGIQEPDLHSHREAIAEAVARPLPPLIGQIASILNTRSITSGKTAKIMETGAGAGCALSSLRTILPNAILHSVGKTEINPFLRPTFNLNDQILERFEMRFQPAHVLLDEKKKDGSPYYLPEQEPFIDHQIIGDFSTLKRADFDEEGYDLIFDQLGAVYYTIEETLPLLRSLLTESGIFLARFLPLKKDALFRKYLKLNDRAYYIRTKNESLFIYAKPQAQLSNLFDTLGDVSIEDPWDY